MRLYNFPTVTTTINDSLHFPFANYFSFCSSKKIMNRNALSCCAICAGNGVSPKILICFHCSDVFRLVIWETPAALV